MTETTPQFSLLKGRQLHSDAGSIGASYCFNANETDDGVPYVLLYVHDDAKDSGERVELREGDTFPIGDELWELTEIRRPHARLWGVLLSQLR